MGPALLTLSVRNAESLGMTARSGGLAGKLGTFLSEAACDPFSFLVYPRPPTTCWLALAGPRQLQTPVTRRRTVSSA